MRILEFSKFDPEYRPITLRISGQDPIPFDLEQTERKESLVRSIINRIYPGFKGNNDFNFDGFVVSGELLNKAQKNISILYEIVDISKSEGNPIKTANDLIEFIETNAQDLFHPDGFFFDRIYKRLGGATEKGRIRESESNQLFKRYAESKGIKVELKPPDSYRQDISGIDAYFIHNQIKYTIQTKTLSRILESGDHYMVYIKGDFTEIKTHYFILIPEDNLFYKKYIFKGKNVIAKKDKNGADYYYVPKENILYTE